MPPGEALAELREALWSTELLWPRKRSAGFAENRLLARRRIEAYADPEPSPDERLATEPLADEERSRLREAFLPGAPRSRRGSPSSSRSSSTTAPATSAATRCAGAPRT